MIYPINIKKKIKESRHLKENVRSVASVAAWLKDSIAAMTANQELTISRRILDSNFGFYVYWTQGFDINDNSVIHADADKSYGLVAALKCRNDAEWDGEYMDSPYDPKTGDLYCEDYELSPKDNTEMVAEWLLEDYNSMIDLINKNPEIVIGGLKESKSVKESYDPEDCYVVWEVRDNSTGEIKRIHSYDKDPEDFSTWLDDDEIINQYADEDMVITRFVYDNGLLDTSEVIWPEDLGESKSIKEEFNIQDYYNQTLNKFNNIHSNVNDDYDTFETGVELAIQDLTDETNKSELFRCDNKKAVKTFTDKLVNTREYDTLRVYPEVKSGYYAVIDYLNRLVNKSKSIKEGLSTKEVLEQAKKLLEK